MKKIVTTVISITRNTKIDAEKSCERRPEGIGSTSSRTGPARRGFTLAGARVDRDKTATKTNPGY